MGQTSEQARNNVVLELRRVAEVADAVSTDLDNLLEEQGYRQPAAEVFLEYLPKDQKGKPGAEKQFVEFIKTHLDYWKDKTFTLKEFMADREQGYNSPPFKEFLSQLKEENKKALREVSLAKRQIEVGFERFFSETCVEFVHSGHPSLEIAQTKEQTGKTTTVKENRVQSCIGAVENFEIGKSASHDLLASCAPLIVALGTVKSLYVTALMASETPSEDTAERLASYQDAQAKALQRAVTELTDLYRKYPDHKRKLETLIGQLVQGAATPKTLSPPAEAAEAGSVVIHAAKTPQAPKRSTLDTLGALGAELDRMTIDKASQAASKVTSKVKEALTFRFSPPSTPTASQEKTPPPSPGNSPKKPGGKG